MNNKHERMQLRDVKQNRRYTIHDIDIYICINNSEEYRHASLSVGAYVAVSSLTAIFIAGQHVLAVMVNEI